MGDYFNENDKAKKNGFDLHKTDILNKKSVNAPDLPEKKIKEDEMPLIGSVNEQWQRVRTENKK